MKIFILTIASLFQTQRAFAHEKGSEITNIAEADWLSPLIAVIVIAFVIIIARIIRKRSKWQITNK